MAEGNQISQSTECILKHNINKNKLGVYPSSMDLFCYCRHLSKANCEYKGNKRPNENEHEEYILLERKIE